MTNLPTPAHPLHELAVENAAEPLVETLMLVARRADALARCHCTATREMDRRVWLRAELDILDGLFEHAVHAA